MTIKGRLGILTACVFAVASLAAQEARLLSAHITPLPLEDGVYSYQLGLISPPDFQSHSPEGLLAEDLGGVKLESLFVKPLRSRKGEWEILIRFRLEPGSNASSFPSLRVSWPSFELIIPAQSLGLAQDGTEASPPPLKEADSKLSWLSGKLPLGAEKAQALGEFRFSAAFDRPKPGKGENLYLELSIEGRGRFQGLKAPRPLYEAKALKLGQPRRYPDYDAQNGEGRLLIRYPLRALAAGRAWVSFAPYAVYEPLSGKIKLVEIPPLSLEVLPDAQGGGQGSAEAPEVKRIDALGPSPILPIFSFIFYALATLALLAALFLFPSGRKKGAILLCLVACGALIAGTWGVLSSVRKSKAEVILVESGTKLYALPHTDASSFSVTETKALKIGDYVDVGAVLWRKLRLEDGSEGWLIFPDR